MAADTPANGNGKGINWQRLAIYLLSTLVLVAGFLAAAVWGHEGRVTRVETKQAESEKRFEQFMRTVEQGIGEIRIDIRQIAHDGKK